MAVPLGSRRTDLIDSSTATPGWQWNSEELPATVTFGFHHAQSQRIDAVGFNPKTDHDPASWARQVKVLVSDHPLRDFLEVGELTLQPADRVQYFEFPAVDARYVQIRIVAKQGESSGVSLGDVLVREALAPGDLSSVARRVQPLPDTDDVRSHAAALAAADLAESEPNDSVENADPLPLGETLAARVSPLSDVDWFEVDTSTAPTEALSLSVAEEPVLRVGLQLFDEGGREVAEQPLYDRGTNRVDLAWALPKGKYRARITRPANSIVVIVDRSDSVSNVRAEIAAAAEAFARQAGPDEAISFATFGGIFNDFSTDPAELIAGARATGVGQGGSAIYSSLSSEIDRLSARAGAKAIVVVTDGEDAGSSAEPLYQLWEKLADTGVRIYTIGYGQRVTIPLDGDLGSTGGDMLRSFSRATGGRFFHAPSGEAMLAVYPTIAADLRGDSAYRLRATAAAGTGELEVIETGEPITGVSAPNQVELIFDASGSMRAKVDSGESRMQVARSVLYQVIEALPDGTQVGLRIYGHRLPREPKDASCGDSELVVPFGELDRDRLHAVVDAVQPSGQTPIGYSLAHLQQDFGEAPGGKVVIVVTDGIETCDPDPSDPFFPPDVITSLLDLGVSMRVNVVGFEIEEDATHEFLSAIAAAGNGVYYNASGAEELTAALAEAVRAEFVVSDSAGREVLRSKVGDPPVVLPEGNWQVTLATDPALDLGEVQIASGRVSTISIAKEGDKVASTVQP